MSVVRERRAQAQERSEAKSSVAKMGVAVVAVVALIGAGGGWAYKTVARRSPSTKMVYTTEKPVDMDSPLQQMKTLLTFNRGKKDGDSAEDFVYSLCSMARSTGEAQKAVGYNPFGGVQAALDKGQAPRPKVDPKVACRNMSKGFIWTKQQR